MGVDLRTEAGAALVVRLAEQADVFIENFRPGVLARRGLGADDLLARNPRLVYCSISGWGQDGPWANRQAYAPLIHAEAGRIELAARLRDEPPRQELHNHGDINAAMCATHAVLAALFQVERTGRGQHLDVSLAEALVYTDEWSSTDVYGYGRERFFDIWTHPVFTLADGTDVAMVGNPVRVWDQWLAALGDDAAPVPRRPRRRARHAARRSWREVSDFPTLEAMLEPYPMLVAEVRSVADLAATPWAEARGLFVELEPDTRVVAAPFRSTRGRRRRARSGAACRRAHTRGAHRAARARRRRARRAGSRRRDLLTGRPGSGRRDQVAGIRTSGSGRRDQDVRIRTSRSGRQDQAVAMRYAFIAKKQTPAATTKVCHHSWYPNHTAMRRGPLQREQHRADGVEQTARERERQQLEVRSRASAPRAPRASRARGTAAR